MKEIKDDLSKCETCGVQDLELNLVKPVLHKRRDWFHAKPQPDFSHIGIRSF